MGCGSDKDNKKSESDSLKEKTIIIGKFRFSGTAESGQYAPLLFKLDRLIRDEMGQNKAWKVIESDRIKDIEKLLNEQKKVMSGGESKDNILTNVDLPDEVQYFVVGEMDGFDLVMADAPVLRDDGQRKTAAKVTGRRRVAFSRISIRLVDVKSKSWLLQKTINFEEPVQDRASAETQINKVLTVMASSIAGEIQLAEAGLPVVAAINANGTLVLNRGKTHGVRLGFQWPLSRNSDPVKDPETGVVLANAGYVIGNVQVIQVSEDYSVAKFTGNEPARIGDRVVAKGESQSFAEPRTQQVRAARVAIGGFVFGPEVDTSIKNSGFCSELEALIQHRLQRSSGMKVVEQDGDNLNKLLAQQMLTDLNKGREPGLPLGTLSGVDYLLFGKIHDVKITEAKDLYLKAVEHTVKGGIPPSGSLRAHLYLQDVNTGENILSQEINLNLSLTGKDTANSQAQLLALFANEANRQFLLGIRPLRIEAAGLDEVMLNHGKAIGLAKGVTLIAYSIGETKRDVYTGQLMEGMGACPAARLEVSDFSARGWAIARIIRGNPQKGMPVKIEQESTPTSNSTEFEGRISPQKRSANTVKRVAIASCTETGNVKKILGDSTNHLKEELEQHFINRLVNDSGFKVADQTRSHVDKLMEQHELRYGPDAPLPAGLLQGVDYLLYCRLLSATIKPGINKYIKAVGETVYRPGKVKLKASLFLQDMQTASYALHETIELDEPWEQSEKSEEVLSRLFAKLTEQGMAKALIIMRPIAVDWVNHDIIGINHGRSAGLKTGNRLDAFNPGKTVIDKFTGASRKGVGSQYVGRIEITRFNPDGWAEAKLIEGEIPEEGALLKLVKRSPQVPKKQKRYNW